MASTACVREYVFSEVANLCLVPAQEGPAPLDRDAGDPLDGRDPVDEPAAMFALGVGEKVPALRRCAPRRERIPRYPSMRFLEALVSPAAGTDGARTNTVG